ncbi:H+/oligopeptide symporter [Handroanthus impetiginosus]|uniref:H+/oligopeptide symporter n=1 Tax=Handroanthus impetiginosus TaxID=429701 RepID=A0A2G9H7E7_9LAMI|nr:H+/oligopeptide symporter [Handroanthus impetiginosus]
MITGNDIPEARDPLLDDVVRGSVDLNGLPARRLKSGCWKSASFIMGVEVAERFAYSGMSSNMISYLTGPLGQSTAVAAQNVNAWSGTAMLLPLLGAFIADSFLGRYRTIIIASLLYILGLGFLSLSALLHSHDSSNCKSNTYNSTCSPPLLEVIFFFFSLYLVAFAQGGHRPCVQAFGADQFDEEDEHESKAKNSLFNWWYFSVNGGILVAFLVLSYIQENVSWELGFGIPCIAMGFALIVFLIGSMTYRFRVNSNERNPFVRISRASSSIVGSIEEGVQQVLSHEHAKLKFLDKAILTTTGSEENGNICSMKDIGDAKEILRLVPIWFACLGYAIIVAQSSTLFNKQGATMDRYIIGNFQIPSASLQSLISLSIVVFIPIYDRVLVPIASSITKKPTGISMLQRIGLGIFLLFLSVVIAAFVEKRRLSIAIQHGLVDLPKATIPMSVWWLAPQYMLYGIADVFTIVGLQEFFYNQIPGELRSIGLALCLSIFGIGNFLSSFLISIIERVTSGNGRYSWFSNNLNRAHLDYFYWLLAGLSVVSMGIYLYFAKSYIYNRNYKI